MIIDALASKWLNWRRDQVLRKSPEWAEIDRELKLHKLENHPGSMKAVLSHPMITVMAEEAAALLNEAHADNYVQFDLMPRLDRGKKPIRVTVQWASKLSPGSKNDLLERENKRLREACAEALETITDWGNGDTPLARVLRGTLKDGG